MKAIKHIRAGVLHREIVGRIPEEMPMRRRRGGRSKTTSAAMQFYNNQCSWHELEFVLANNFGKADFVLALTYDDQHLPKDKAAAKTCMKKFLRKYREVRRKRGEELRYCYVTEGFHGAEHDEHFGVDTELEDKRLHHHIVVNCRDIDEIRSLWEYGTVVHYDLLNIHYYEELAKYLTKEALVYGRAKPGERTWNCSRNLDRKIEVEYYEVPDSVTLTAPEGAVDYRIWYEKNPYGYADCLGARYLLFPQDEQPKPSYAVGRKSKSA